MKYDVLKTTTLRRTEIEFDAKNHKEVVLDLYKQFNNPSIMYNGRTDKQTISFIVEEEVTE